MPPPTKASSAADGRQPSGSTMIASGSTANPLNSIPAATLEALVRRPARPPAKSATPKVTADANAARGERGEATGLLVGLGVTSSGVQVGYLSRTTPCNTLKASKWLQCARGRAGGRAGRTGVPGRVRQRVRKRTSPPRRRTGPSLPGSRRARHESARGSRPHDGCRLDRPPPTPRDLGGPAVRGVCQGGRGTRIVARGRERPARGGPGRPAPVLGQGWRCPCLEARCWKHGRAPGDSKAAGGLRPCALPVADRPRLAGSTRRLQRASLR